MAGRVGARPQEAPSSPGLGTWPSPHGPGLPCTVWGEPRCTERAAGFLREPFLLRARGRSSGILGALSHVSLATSIVPALPARPALSLGPRMASASQTLAAPVGGGTEVRVTGLLAAPASGAPALLTTAQTRVDFETSETHDREKAPHGGARTLDMGFPSECGLHLRGERRR